MLRAREKGSPRSRAKDHVMRDAAAKQPIALQNSRRTMMETIIVAPKSEPTAWLKMRRKGAVGASASASKCGMSWALKRTARSMPRAKVPLMKRLSSIERGTSVLAFLTSSDILRLLAEYFGSMYRLTCTTESVPTNARALPCRPTKKASVWVLHAPSLWKVKKISFAELCEGVR